ncbi:hypothetical protein TruAng_001801 [Truncatella angustata]|nr:hypothetical protein TruAng_001801 [Truncatella angustata]
MNAPEPRDNAAALERYLLDARFSQSFTLPPGSDRPEPFTVTYSDYGYRNQDEPSQENVLLFCGPLLSTRFLHVAKDELAKRYRVRIIHPDRPGMGGTTDTEAKASLRVWLDIVSALLQHLGVSKISLACHSAGTIYALHTALHLRHLLHPDRPYIALCGPWVHPEHSGTKLMELSNALPVAILSRFDGVVSIVRSSVLPVVGFSDVLLSSLVPKWAQRTPPPIQTADTEMVKFEKKLQPQVLKHAYAENYKGMSQDVLLLLKKHIPANPEGEEGWGDWGDVDKYVPMLAEREEERRRREQHSDLSSHQLEVEVFFAKSDHMIGSTTGPQWFRDCWRPEQRGRAIGFQSHVVEGADHDSLLDIRHGVAEEIFRKISGIGGD